MRTIKEKIISRLGILDEIKPVKPSALDLHGRRPLMARVQRQAQREYMQKILKQKEDLKVKLAKINKYYADLQKEEQRRLDVIAAYYTGVESPILKTNEELLPLEPAPLPIFQPINLVVPKPIVSFHSPMPVQARIRIRSRARAKKLRRVR